MRHLDHSALCEEDQVHIQQRFELGRGHSQARHWLLYLLVVLVVREMMQGVVFSWTLDSHLNASVPPLEEAEIQFVVLVLVYEEEQEIGLVVQ